MKQPEAMERRNSEAEAAILVVDDRGENLAAFEALLSPLGLDVVLARSGADALEQAMTRPLAVIVLDAHMPVMDGFETALLLRKREASRMTPIIFTSAYSIRVEDMKGAYVAGATDFVDDPAGAELLKFKVAAFVELYRRTERMRRSAEDAATALADLKHEVDRSVAPRSVREPLERLEHAISGIESDLLPERR